MATADIVARLKLSAQNFTGELDKAVGGAERKFGNTGSVIGRNLATGIGGGLQNAAAQVPVVGNLLAGLSGSALIAAGGVGLIGAAFASGVRDAEALAQATRGLNAVLDATGNKTGLSKAQLLGFSEEIESAFAISQEEVLRAQTVLSQYDGVAGTTFKRSIELAGDMAAVFGGDLAGNSDKLGGALQNLATGNVEGLTRAFKFLGTETLNTVENLAKAGKAAQAQEALLAGLEGRIGGAAEANAKGLSGAWFHLTDNIGDATRKMVEQTNAIPALIGMLNALSNAIPGDGKKKPDGLGYGVVGVINRMIVGGAGGVMSAPSRGERFVAENYGFGEGGIGGWAAERKERGSAQGSAAADAAAAAATAARNAAERGETGKRTDAQRLAAFRTELEKRGASVTSTTRSYAQQARLYAIDPNNAAKPGTSEHEVSRGIDVGKNTPEAVIYAAARAARVDIKDPLLHGARLGLHKHIGIKGDGQGSSGDGEAEVERLAEKRQAAADVLAKAEADLTKRVSETTREQAEQLRLGELRVAGLASEAERYEAMAAVAARFPELAASATAKDQERLQVLQEQALALLDQRGEIDRLARAKDDALRATEAQAAVDEDGVRLARVRADMEEEAAKVMRDQWEADARRQREEIDDLATFYRRAFDGGSKGLWRDFKDQGLDVIAELAAQWTLGMLSGNGSGFGDILSQINTSQSAQGGPMGLLMSLGGKLFGGGSDKLGASINAVAAGTGAFRVGVPGLVSGAGAALPGAAGAASAAGGLMGAASTAMPYVAAAAAAFTIVQSLGLFKKTKKGSASLGFDGYGDLGVTSTSGNSAKRREAASSALGGVSDTLSRIAEQLGGSLGGTPSVSLGIRDGSYRVDTSGQGRTKKGAGVLDFGKDQEAAIRAALSEALKDGVVQGISDASKRILQSGQELERAIEKAAMIEDIPRQLRARMDPVGAALDELNRRWDKTVAALKEGSASAEQMADAQKLYKLELDDTKASAGEASASLKAFLDSMGFGSASPYSLRDQETKALAALQPYLDKIDAGSAIDQGKYQEFASAYLDIERQMNGSTGAYFAAQDRIQGATGRAIATIDNAVPIRTASDPFAEKTSANTLASAEILAGQTQQLADIKTLLGQILDNGGSMSGFIGTDRGFTGGALISTSRMVAV